MVGVTFGQLSQATVGAFELGLAILLLTAGRVDARRGGAAVLFLAHAASMWALVFGVDLAGTLFWPGWGVLDHIIVYTVPFLLTQFPTPMLGHKRNHWLVIGWIVIVLFGVALIQTNTPPRPDWNLLPEGNHLISRMQAFAFPLGAAIAVFHTLPRALGLQDGPLRTQALLVFVALATNIFHYGFIRLDWNLTPFSDGRLPPGDHVRTVFTSLAGIAGFYALVKCSSRALQRRDAVIGFVAVLLVIASLRGLSGFTNPGSSRAVIVVPSEFMSQMIRPTLLAVALVRYDLFRIPWRVRAFTQPAMMALLGLSVFSLFVVVLQRDAWRSPDLPAMAIVAGLALTAGVFLTAQKAIPDLTRIPRPGGRNDLDQRMRRYRLALEHADAMGQGHQGRDLLRLRNDLGITQGQHDAMSSLLAGHVVMPRTVAQGLQPGDVLRHRYRIARRLGSGGQGNAFLATDEQSGKQVVVKEVGLMWRRSADDHVRRLRREGELNRIIDSPYVAKTLDVLDDEWGMHLIREYIDGPTLKEHLDAGRHRIEATDAIMAQVAQGLAATHAKGISHGDIKPANIVLGAHGAVVIDFGAATPQDAEATAVLSGVSRGWASPEHLAGRPPSPASDVFQLGLVWCRTRHGDHGCGAGCSLATGMAAEMLRPAPEDRPMATEVAAAIRMDAP